MKRHLLLISIAAAALLSVPNPSRATKGERKTARKYFRLGKRLFAKGQYPEAIEAFRKAGRFWKHRVIHFNIALSYAFMGKTIIAAGHLRTYLKTATPAERNLPEILQKVLQKTGVLVIHVPDPAAAVFVDGRHVGNGRVELILMAGKHAADIRMGKVVVANRIITVPPAGEKVWELAEVPRPRPKPPAGGKRMPTLPGPSGAAVEPDRKRPAGIHWAYFTAAVVLTAGAAGGAGAMIYKWQDALDEFNDGGKRDASLKKRGIRYYYASIGLGAGAGAAAVTAVLLGVFTRWRRKESQVSVAPAAGPGTVGLTVNW